MLGREEGVLHGVEGSSDSDAPSISKKGDMEGHTLPISEVV